MWPTEIKDIHQVGVQNFKLPHLTYFPNITNLPHRYLKKLTYSVNVDIYILDPNLSCYFRERKKNQFHKTPSGREFQSEGQGQNEGRRTYDVRGKPKGQGQEKDVLKNRSWKEKNKATRVHHNRKVLADKKRKF